jgi:hypothetical protein
MNQEEQLLIDSLIKESQVKSNELADTKNVLSRYSQNELNNPALIQIQLDPDKILERIYHSLSQHVLVNENVNGVNKTYWAEQKDVRVRTLSNLGVEIIMDKLNKYLSPAIILSNHDETQVQWKMHDIGIELNNLFFTKYEDIFYHPDEWELFFYYLPHIKRLGYINEFELYLRCLELSEDILSTKLKEYTILLNDLLNIIHATYLRSLGGEELKGLRRMTQVSQTQTTSMYPTIDPKQKGVNPR